jgi:hypothetical protein
LPFDTFCGHLVFFPVSVCLDQEKSGNPDFYRGKVSRGAGSGRNHSFLCLEKALKYNVPIAFSEEGEKLIAEK